jgi:predicted RND superfamily exporter protein
MSDLLAGLSHSCARRPVTALAILLVAVAGFVLLAPPAEQADIDEVFVPEDLPARQAQERIEATFGDTTPVLVLFEDVDPTDPQLLRAQARLPAAYEDLEPASARSLAASVEQATDRPIAELDDAELRAAAERVRQAPGPASGLVGEDASLVQLAFPGDVDPQRLVDATDRVLEDTRGDAPAAVSATGPAHLEVDQRETGQGDLQILMPLAGLVVVAVLYATFRRALDVAVSLVTVAAATVLAYAALPWLEVPLSPLLFSVAPLLVGLGVDYVLHILYAYRAEARSHGSVPDAVSAAVDRVARPVTFTVVTTCIGFGSFLASPIPQIQHWGALIGSGALAAFLLGFTLLPALLGLRGNLRAPEDARRSWSGALVDRLAGPVSDHPGPVLAGVGLLTLAAATGIPAVGLAEDVADTTQTPARATLDAIDAKIGGPSQAQILVDAEAADHREALDELSRRLANVSGVTSVDSPTQRARAANNGSLPGPQAYRTLLADGPAGELAEDGLTLIELRYTGDGDSLQTNVTPILADSPLDAQLTGASVLQGESRELILENLVRSTALALGLVALTLAAIHRSWRWTAITAAPLVVVIVWQFGAMGWVGVDLNPVTGVTTAMVIGIGVDYAIHTTEATREGIQRGRSATRAAREAVETVGRPVLAATVTTTGAFLVLAVSGNPQVAQFGRVAATVIVFAFVATLATVPALSALGSEEPTPPATESGRASTPRERGSRLHPVRCRECQATGLVGLPSDLGHRPEARCRSCGGQAVIGEPAGKAPPIPESGPFRRCLACRARWAADGRRAEGFELTACPRCGGTDRLRRVDRAPSEPQ